MSEPVVIGRRFRGPDNSAHGGYACGLTAIEIDAPVATVSLRRPPPLETPLQVRRAGDSAELLDGDVVISEAEPTELSLDTPPPVPADVAAGAGAHNPWFDKHPFPNCFGCGPNRDPDEAIRTILGRLPGGDVFATTWTPRPDLADAAGRVTKLFTWAALDCPTGAAAIDPVAGPHVLARLSADPWIAPIAAGVEHVVLAWLVGREGRKSLGAAAIYDPDGRVCALGEGLWIRLRDPAVAGAHT